MKREVPSRSKSKRKKPTEGRWWLNALELLRATAGSGSHGLISGAVPGMPFPGEIPKGGREKGLRE